MKKKIMLGVVTLFLTGTVSSLHAQQSRNLRVSQTPICKKLTSDNSSNYQVPLTETEQTVIQREKDLKRARDIETKRLETLARQKATRQKVAHPQIEE